MHMSQVSERSPKRVTGYSDQRRLRRRQRLCDNAYTNTNRRCRELSAEIYPSFVTWYSSTATNIYKRDSADRAFPFLFVSLPPGSFKCSGRRTQRRR